MKETSDHHGFMLDRTRPETQKPIEVSILWTSKGE